MSKLVKCDHCGETRADDFVVDWLELDRYGHCHVSFWPASGPVHFCSWECLLGWVHWHRPKREVEEAATA